MQYRIEIESGPRNYSAYSLDVPGCVATGATEAECRRNMEEALAFHIEMMREEGLPIPVPGKVDAPVTA